jgi:hypothetical protein
LLPTQDVAIRGSAVCGALDPAIREHINWMAAIWNYRWRIQPVNATVWLNISAGV